LDLTPRELQVWFEGAAWRQEQDWRRASWIAWNTAALIRSKKMPSWAQFGGAEHREVSRDELARRKAEHAEMVKKYEERHGR
jgi:hypothetical protein